MGSAMNEGLRPGKWRFRTIAQLGRLNARSLWSPRVNSCLLKLLLPPPQPASQQPSPPSCLLLACPRQRCLVPVVLLPIILGKEVQHAPRKGLQKFEAYPSFLLLLATAEIRAMLVHVVRLLPEIFVIYIFNRSKSSCNVHPAGCL